VVDFNDLYRKIMEGNSSVVTLENKMGTRILIDRREALSKQKEILRRYNIEYDRSPDLRK